MASKPSDKKVGDLPMPKCPYCDKPVTLNEDARDPQNEVQKEVKGTIKKEVMYNCPHCQKVLGFGYFMGGVLTGRP